MVRKCTAQIQLTNRILLEVQSFERGLVQLLCINPFWSSMGALIRENVCRSSWRLELHILFEGLSDSDYQWPSGGPWRCDPYAPLMETWRDPDELVVCLVVKTASS